jgi:hypothetical protein
MRYLICTLLFVTLVCDSFSQRTTVEDYRMQQEQMKKPGLLQQMDSGVYYMDIGDHLKAFRRILHFFLAKTHTICRSTNKPLTG